MSCEGNMMSDERIGEALIKEVIEEELKEVPSEEVPSLTPLTQNVKTEQEKKVVNQLAKMIRIVGDKVQDDQEFQEWERFNEVADKVFEQGITWERIAVLFYVAGKLAVKLVEAHLPQSVKDILTWTVKFFRNNLLGWIRDHGGWINSFSDLAKASVNKVSSTYPSCGLLVIFIAGLALGSVITWKLTRQQ